MDEVYVVIESYWNGEYSSKSAHRVFACKETADRYVESLNAARTSDYSTEYSVEDVEFEA